MLVALVAFGCYWATLLPGLDFGDTASFQTGVGSLTLTPRQAYPLYYALGNVFVWLDPHEPAHAMNLASAVYGALAAGLAALVAAELAGSALAGLAAGLFLAFSYTFWTQATIAEVYSLHLLILGLCMTALLGWSRRPTLGRLLLFYAAYALGFGNHLSTILLLPAFAVFILLERSHGAGDPLRPKAILMAVFIAGLGALQYIWNVQGLWTIDPPPLGFIDTWQAFWFDVTKSDWRASLVATVSEAGLENRPALYWFDLRQQFGVPGVLLAAAGFVHVSWRRPSCGLLLCLLYLVNLVFAWTYNVGDVHVFFLPSHYVVALCAGAGVSAVASLLEARSSRLGTRSSELIARSLATLLLMYPIWRGYDTLPAVDRSWDDRPVQVFERFTAAPDPYRSSALLADAVFGVEANWQVQNAVEYYMRRHKPDVPWFIIGDLAWLARDNMTGRVQAFADANLRMGREVVVTPGFASQLRALGYAGEAVPLAAADQIGALQQGAPYALGVLRPTGEYPINVSELNALWSNLTGGSAALPTLRDYTIAVGAVGQPPVLVDARDRPFRTHARVGSTNFDIRIESWLPTDTIRRAGFGHVIVGRAHLLTLERGVSLAVLGPSGKPSLIAYRSGIFAPLPRLLLRGGGNRR